jgi:N-acetylglucosamine-6-phosphate deacetylase
MIPGLVDLQVNGYRGVDFSGAGLTPDEIERVSADLWERGVVAYCPTVVTSPREIYARNLPMLAEAADSTVGAQILGVHIEGPFIRPDDGPRGAHRAEHVMPASSEFFDQLRAWAHDRIALLTLAPEIDGGIELTKHIATTSGVVVSLGHHVADAATIRQAVEAGARACTHVGNGLPRTIDRHDNPIWPMLAEDRLMGCFITDGHHLPGDLIRVCLRAKGVERFIVTSDMNALAGQPPGEYAGHGITVILEPNGRVRRKGSYMLAGSGCDMLHDMNVLAGLGETTEAQLQAVGRDNALALLGATLDRERLARTPRFSLDGEKLDAAPGG